MQVLVSDATVTAHLMPEEEARRAESEFITIEVIMEDGRPGEKVTRARHRHGTIPGTLDGRRPTKS